MYVLTNICTMYLLQKCASHFKKRESFEPLETALESGIPADSLEEVSDPVMSKYMCMYKFVFHE